MLLRKFEDLRRTIEKQDAGNFWLELSADVVYCRMEDFNRVWRRL
jgi:hypothetical protein